ncbi:MAG: ABC transporter permease [Deltaproteobacteria bacterium]|nr:MAG: ABC transporter permease [Deltaproteobacteria bacterium]
MKLGHTSSKYYKFITYAVVVVLLNAAGLTFFKRMDLTAGKLYSISNVSKTVVSTLTEPLTINVFFTKNLPAPHNSTERYLHDLLSEYAASANQNFNYRFYDVSPDQGDLGNATVENQALAGSFGIRPIQIQAIEKDEVKFQKAYMGLVIIHGDQLERIPTITTTDGLEYKLTMAMRKLNNKVSALLALEDRIHVDLYMSSSLMDVAPLMKLEDLKNLPRQLEEMVGRININSYGKLAFEHKDPTRTPDLKDALAKYRILNLNWPDLDDGRIKAGQGAIGLVMSYGEKAISTPLMQVIEVPIFGTQYQLADLEQMEEIISANMESLIDINQNLGVLTDFGSLPIVSPPEPSQMGPPPEQAENFKTLASQNYSLKEVALKEGSLPDTVNCLVVPGPKEKFSDYDLFQIDQFLMKGKSLAIFMDSLREVRSDNSGFQMPGMNTGFVPMESGLEKLLSHYGIDVHPSIVYDEECFKQRVPREMGGGERLIYFAPLIKNANINNQLGYMQNITALIALKVSPISIDLEKIKTHNLKANLLFQSSARAWEMKEGINLNPNFIKLPDPDIERKKFDLAYMVEGEFPSYFAGKPVPEKPKEEKPAGKDEEAAGAETEKEADATEMIERKRDIIEKGKPGKIFILASSDMIKDNLIDKEGRGPNDVFVMNILDYLNEREEVARLRSKQQRFTPLNETGAFTKTVVKTFNIVGLPIVVVFFGLGVWARRTSRKKSIQREFS